MLGITLELFNQFAIVSELINRSQNSLCTMSKQQLISSFTAH